MTHKWWILLLAFTALFLGVWALRSSRKPTHAVKKPPSQTTKRIPGIYVPPSVPRAPAPRQVVTKSLDEASLRATYDSFRTAVATGNQRLQAALRPVLWSRNELAVSWAENEIRCARDGVGRELALKTLESLGR